MALKIWTTADAALLSKTFGRAFLSHRPHVPEHSFHTLEEANPPLDGDAGDVVIVCGNKPMDVLRREGIIPKNRTLNSMREKPIVARGTTYLTTFDPYAILTNPEHYSTFEWDVRLATRLMKTGSTAPILGRYRWVNDYQPMIDWIEERYKETDAPVEVSTDLETMGFYPWYPDKDIISISFTAIPETSDVLYLGPQDAPIAFDPTVKLFDQIKWLLTSPKVRLRLANGKFDLIWIAEKWGIECTNFKFDTMLVGTILDENRSNGLSNHAKLLTNLGGYDTHFDATHDKGHMELIKPADGLLTYAGGDTDATHRVADVLRSELLEDPALTRFYVTILHPAARAFEKMERRGVLVDQHKYQNLRDELATVIQAQQKHALELLPAKIRIKHREKIEDQIKQGKNPLLPSILKEFFFSANGLNLKPLEKTGKTQEPSMAKSHLRQFGTVPEAAAMVKCLTEMDGASKTLSTFVDGFLKHLRPDGRLHPTYFLGKSEFEGQKDDSGTVTGRLSAKDPAFQCMTGDTLVLTQKGNVRLDALVECGGVGFKVLTHTGAWREITDVYRNGVKPVYEVVTSTGARFRATGNHPVLTQSGFIPVEQLTVGDKAHEYPWTLTEGQEDANLSKLGRHEDPLRQSEKHSVSSLRWAGDYLRSEMVGLSGILEGHGRNAAGVLYRKEGREWELLPSELRVGSSPSATTEHPCQSLDHISGGDEVLQRVGTCEGDYPCSSQETATERLVIGEGFGDARSAYAAGFAITEIVSINLIGALETFDLTIDACHSFVANGVIVHNTLPKKTFWAKRLRGCFPAPEGMTTISLDYSQGELKVVACVAGEQTMIQAYQAGRDLHAVTGAALAGLDFDEFMSWSTSDDAILAAHFDTHRGNAKPANFGLLYGMGVEGFMAYAWASYGKRFTLAEATAMRDAFFALYPRLLTYHGKQRELVKKFQMVRSPLGRVRHLPHIASYDRAIKSQAERQAINSPIQSTLSDMMLWAISMIEDAYPNGGIQLVGMIHDAVIAYVPKGQELLWSQRATEVMSNLPFGDLGWSPVLKFTADAEAGDTLASLKKLKL